MGMVFVFSIPWILIIIRHVSVLFEIVFIRDLKKFHLYICLTCSEYYCIFDSYNRMNLLNINFPVYSYCLTLYF